MTAILRARAQGSERPIRMLAGGAATAETLWRRRMRWRCCDGDAARCWRWCDGKGSEACAHGEDGRRTCSLRHAQEMLAIRDFLNCPPPLRSPAWYECVHSSTLGSLECRSMLRGLACPYCHCPIRWPVERPARRGSHRRNWPSMEHRRPKTTVLICKHVL